jgi:membrane-associated phospholipid phosphatase
MPAGMAVQPGRGDSSNVQHLAVVGRGLALSSIACAAIVVLAFLYLDVPIARALWRGSDLLKPLGGPFGSIILLSGEGTVLLALGIARLVRGSLPRLAATLALACLASIGAYVANDFLFKPLFGVPTPLDIMRGIGHNTHLGLGSARSSFPSGHMVMASGFASVFMRRHEASIRPLAGLLLAGAALLLAGDWHFLSDVIAGGFIGLWAGWLIADILATARG